MKTTISQSGFEECLKSKRIMPPFISNWKITWPKDYKKRIVLWTYTQIDPTNKWFWVNVWRRLWNQRLWQRHKNDWKLILLTLNSKKTWLRFTWAQANLTKHCSSLMNSMNRPSQKGNLIMQILSQGKYQNAEISNLIDQIKSILKRNRITLIYLYSKNNETDKVLETARNWNSNTHSEWAQVSLFKDYLENNEGEKP
jgi:hypothetical protein